MTPVESAVPPEPPPAFVGRFELLCLAFAALWVVAHRHGSLPRGLAVMAVLLLIYMAGFFVAGRLAGARVLRVTLLYGRAIARFRVGPTWVSIGWIPLGGNVKFDGYRDPTDPASAAPPRPGSWAALPLPARVGVPLVGPAVLVATALVLLGPARAASAAAAIVPNAIALFTPDRQAGLAGALRRAVLDLPFLTVLGLAAAKQAIVDLMPVPPTNASTAVTNLFMAAVGRPDPPAAVRAANVIGTLVFLVAFVETAYVLLAC